MIDPPGKLEERRARREELRTRAYYKKADEIGSVDGGSAAHAALSTQHAHAKGVGCWSVYPDPRNTVVFMCTIWAVWLYQYVCIM
jgi:hypothetical protein